jgi:ADP-ribosylglycohydrolase
MTALGGATNPYVGPSSRRACELLKAGADPLTTGVHGDTDGGAMRVSPVGLINPGDVDRAIAEAVVACTPTQFTAVAVSGAAAVAAAVAAAMVPGATLDDILDAGKVGAIEGRKHGEVWLGASINRRIDMAADIARGPGSEYDRVIDMFELVGSTLMTTDTVPSAFGMVVLSDGDLMACARYSAAISGDADTVGAIACAIVGAWKGIGAFPAEVVATLETVNAEYDFRAVAEGLTDLAIERRG